MKAIDSLVNFVSGLGTSRDKSVSDQFYYTPITKDQLDAAFRTDWVARKTVCVPAGDSTAEWRAWQADQSDTTLLEKSERVLRIRSAVNSALVRARLYGGALVVMGVDDGGAPDQPLNIERVRIGGMKFVHVLNRFEVSTGTLDTDPMSPRFGEPEYYMVSTTKGAVKIHPSRTIRFIGAEIPDAALAPDGWGDSVLQPVYDAVMNVARSTSGIAALIHEAKVDIIKIPGLMQQIATSEYERQLMRRVTLAATAKSVVNTLILDAEEQYERNTISFAQLPELMQQYIQIAAGAADIPATRFVGMAPAGLNATGESDLRNYAIRLQNDQENTLTPALERLDEVLIRSTFGTRPEELHYCWRPVFGMTELQRADIDAKRAATFQIDLNSGLFTNECMFEARKAQIVEAGTYPGFAEYAALEDMDMPEPGEEPDTDAMLAGETGVKVRHEAVAEEAPDDETDAQ